MGIKTLERAENDKHTLLEDQYLPTVLSSTIMVPLF